MPGSADVSANASFIPLNLFEAQAGRTPHALAVTYEGESLSYAELNRKANQLANYLREKGVGPNQPVGICVERGLAMVIGLLGILKAGGGYVPLDPNYPADRLQYILDDAAPSVVLIEEKLRPALPPTRATVVALDSAWAEIGQRPDSVAVNPADSHPEHLAYVIYTSGSTGKPKGVMVEHRNVTRLFAATDHWFKFNERDVWTLFHSFAFDFSVWELWGALFYGGRVVVVPYRTARSPQDFYQLVCDERVTVLNQTPSAFAQLIDARARAPQKKHSLRVVIFGGEALELRMLRPWIELEGAEQTQLVNMYGITETTVHVTYRPPLTREQIEREHGSGIGQPIPDLSAYLLDRHQQLLPIGVVGEMYIGGGGVARGYLNRAELTAERFIRDPFSADPRARLYKTGDLGRWRADGTLEYLGRNDLQVKIRGFRIELGEIEAQLARHAEVREAVVLARADVPGDKRLVAYVIAVDATAPKADALRAHLRNLLPEYMVPSAFVMLETFPLTSNGKLDRRALPAPERDAYASREYAAPVGDTEQLLAQIWKDLLHVEQVGRNDNFFELGGHSLLIMQMMERVRGHGLTTEVRRVFESPTLADLAGTLTRATTSAVQAPPNLIPPNCAVLTPEMLPLIDLNLEHIERIVAAVPGGASNIQDVYPLAPLQEGILFHHLMSEHGDTYVVPTLLAVASRREVDELIAALQGVIDRHDVLRTAVLWEELPQPVQVVHRKSRLPVEEVVLDGARDVREQVASWLDAPTQIMDLRLAPLLRLRIAADPNCGQWFVLLTQHHIVSDNTSQAIVFSEIAAHLDGRSEVLPAPLPYRNHVAQALAYARTHDAEAFFRKKLGDVDEPTVPFGLLDVRGDHLDVIEAQETLSSELAQRVRAQARRLGVSAATLFHAAWAVVVANTSGKDDVVFGSVLLGRMHSNNGAQQILGMFINTLPLRLNLRAATAAGLVENTQRELVDLLSHEQASLADAQRCSAIDGATPLFTALLNFRHGVGAGAASLSSRPDIQVLAERTGTNYPITVSVDDLGEGFSITAQTHRHVDPQRVAAYLRTAVESLLDALEHSPNVRALTLPILPALERQQVIEQFNAADISYPRGRLVHQLFEEQALRTPTAIAVLHDERSITYAELNEEANKLARYLLALGAGPEELVGICAERSIEMVIGLLGILKAGAAYLPLDPNYPAERLRYMLDDGAPRVVLTQQSLTALLGQHEAAISLEEVFKDMGSLSARNIAASEVAQDPRNTVYVIYTSGSTGRPKGTAMPHAAMVNLIEWHRHTFGSTVGQRVLQFAALSFDVAFQEVFSTLGTGGTLVLLDEWMRRDPRALAELLASQEIARLFVPPLMLHRIAETVATESAHVDLSRLRDVITAGEQLRISPEISAMFGKLQGCRLHNHYGPTETHVVTALTLQGEPQAWPVLPSIGRPIANTHIYVLNRQGLPTPIGVAGEVYIAGEGVARGYLRRPGLTAERFISAAFGAASRCMYKTGDLGRWLSDGTLEHLGRNDDQVKIRGFRVELGEIEARLALHESVKEAAVIAREDVPGEKRLVAYVTSAEATPPTVESLREHIKAALPEHMVPSAFVVLESMPLTPSGKLSRRSLPQPELGAYASKEYEPPRGEVEQALAEIFQELLRADRVGRDDSFFELGGHSILAMQVTARIRSNLRVEMPIKTIFDRPTIAELAEYVAERQVDTHELLARVASMADEDARALLHGLRMEA
nr:non-ribosomal peptide synthetase [Steroidobacter cummioxidans]